MQTYLPAVTLGGGRGGGALVDWCGHLVDGHGSPLLGAQGAAGRASLVVLMMRHGGQCGPPSTLSPADLEHPRALISLLSVHLKEQRSGGYGFLVSPQYFIESRGSSLWLFLLFVRRHQVVFLTYYNANMTVWFPVL